MPTQLRILKNMVCGKCISKIITKHVEKVLIEKSKGEGI
jgi:hypothetical protein